MTLILIELRKNEDWEDLSVSTDEAFDYIGDGLSEFSEHYSLNVGSDKVNQTVLD